MLLPFFALKHTRTHTHTHLRTHSFCPALVVMSQLLRLNQNLAVSYHSITHEWCNESAVLYVHVCVCLRVSLYDHDLALEGMNQRMCVNCVKRQ